MAPIGFDKGRLAISFTAKKAVREDNDNDNLWSSILAEVRNSGNNKLPTNKHIIVLGDNESGKTTLIAKLQGVEDPKKGSGLEFAYIDVRDEYRDDQTRLSVWVLDGDPGHKNLLKFAISPEKFQNSFLVLVVAMTTPWAILDQLRFWAKVFADHLDKLASENSSFKETWQKCRQQNIRRWQEYLEPGDDIDPGSPMKRTSRNLDDFADDLPLPEGVLTTNLGLDIVVVVTKTDYMAMLEKGNDYRDEHFDFIQQWVRRFCLQYGAGLFYTSVKEDKNCDLLYKYLTHRIYNLPFKTPALVVEKDAVLIPSGWDNLKKIAILHENLQAIRPDDYYTDIIMQPIINRKTVTKEAEVIADDEQTFLARQLEALIGLKDSVRSTQNSRNQVSLASKKLDTKNSTSSSSGEGVLANFFNSLLNKKTTGSPGGVSSPNTSTSNSSKHDSPADNAMMRSDAAAELDRITKGKKMPVSDLNNSSEL